MSAPFGSLENMLADAALSLRPAEKLSVTEAAEKYRDMSNQVRIGKFSRDVTPYTAEIQDSTHSRLYSSVAFVGPAQVGKTEIVFNLMMHTAICSPMDMLVIEKDQTSARDFAIRRVQKLLRDTPEMDKLVLPGKQNRSIYNLRFKSGMIATMAWPTVNQLSGRPIGKLWLSDYDRMDKDIGGEGSAFDLARKRSTTFGRNRMTVAESSPSRPLDNPRWRPSSPHEGPPVDGIVGIYNQGDRRRWYWQCIDCYDWFEPSFSLIDYDHDLPPAKAGDGARMLCPHCGSPYYHDGEESADGTRRPGKDELNLAGCWVKDGQYLDKDGNICGEVLNPSETASFWLKGPAAKFTDWKTLVFREMTALRELELTGNDSSLKTTRNTDQGEVYCSAGTDGARLPEDMMARAQDLGDRTVPEGVLFLLASVDTQKNRWEVQIHGVGEDMRIFVIDRFKILKSRRTDEDGERFFVKPHAYIEDWDLLVEQVLDKTYELGDGSGRRMAVKHMCVDSGGLDGVATRAYEWWRGLKKEGSHKRVSLLKGEPSPRAPMVRVTFPDSDRKDRRAANRGEVPVMMIQTDKVKDAVSALLDREEDGPGFVSFPEWLPDWWYAELTAETRDNSGKWKRPSNTNNEAFDLLVYCYAMMVSKEVRADRIQWDNPPPFARGWDENPLVIAKKGDKPFENHPKSEYSLESMGELLA